MKKYLSCSVYLNFNEPLKIYNIISLFSSFMNGETNEQKL